LAYKTSEVIDKTCHQNDSTDLEFAPIAADKYHSLSRIKTFFGTSCFNKLCKTIGSDLATGETSGAYTESISTGTEFQTSRLLNWTLLQPLRHTYRISLISSKCIVPVPPAAGLFFVPMPMVIVLRLVRFTPTNAWRSITHWFHPAICVAAESS